MPLNEYKCEKCGHKFEQIEPYSAALVKKCPKCGAKAERQISAAGIQFKVSGWYVTDYKGKSPASGTSESGSDSNSSSDGSLPIQRRAIRIGDIVTRCRTFSGGNLRSIG